MREPAGHGQGLYLALLGALLLMYLAVSLRHLTIVPPVYEDEPWQASTGLKLAQEGVFGSDLFHGLNGMERRYYGYMPVHPLLLAATYRIAGFGLLQTRLEPVMMGLAILLLTYALGRRLFDPTVALVAVSLLLLTRTAGLTRSQLTGILLIDIARIGRYDMVVPVFGLSSLHLYLWADERRDSRWLFAAAGLCAGLAGLSHVYGAFWVVILGALARWNGAGWYSITALGLGFAAPWLAYLSYVLGDLPAWVAQTRDYAPRFRLTSAAWYWANLVNEPRRYGPGLGPVGLHYVLRPGFWTALVVLPTALVALFHRARGRVAQSARAVQETRAARAVIVPAIVFPLLFGLLIIMKLANYLVTLVPIGALAAAWGGVTCWRWLGSRKSLARWGRAALGAVLLAVAAEGISRYVALERAAAATTPYADFIARVRAQIPPRARILGLHNYWFGLEDFDYRSFFAPLALSSPEPTLRRPSFEEALDAVAPTVVLLDERMRSFFADAGVQARGQSAMLDWLARRGFVLASTVDDPTYGRIEIFSLRTVRQMDNGKPETEDWK